MYNHYITNITLKCSLPSAKAIRVAGELLQLWINLADIIGTATQDNSSVVILDIVDEQ